MKNNNLSSYFSTANLRFNIHNLSYLPRWIIVLIDFTVLLFAFLLTYIIYNRAGLEYITTTHKVIYISSLFGINIFFFWLFRTYSGIIRHSSYIDAVKLLFSQSAVLVFLLFFNFLFRSVHQHRPFFLWVVCL